jgi:hypothetical protein
MLDNLFLCHKSRSMWLHSPHVAGPALEWGFGNDVLLWLVSGISG